MRKISTWICLVLWVFIGIVRIRREVTKWTFYCCLACLIIKYVEDLIREIQLIRKDRKIVRFKKRK